MGSPALSIISALLTALWGTVYFRNRKKTKKNGLSLSRRLPPACPWERPFSVVFPAVFRIPSVWGSRRALFSARRRMFFLSFIFSPEWVCLPSDTSASLPPCCPAAPLSGRHLIFFLLLFAASLLFHGRKLPQTGALALPIVLYGALLSAMTAAALAVFPQAPGAAAGALLFYLSDNMICLRLYRPDHSDTFSAFVLIFYYSAIWLLCSSACLF